MTQIHDTVFRTSPDPAPFRQLRICRFPFSPALPSDKNHSCDQQKDTQISGPVSHTVVERSLRIGVDGITESIFRLILRLHPHPSIRRDRKSTRLNSSHVAISYAV